MRVTKFVHSCLLVETPERVGLFDPGAYSRPVFDINKVDKLDDILITHVHGDHCDIEFIKELVNKFPSVRVTSTNEVVNLLKNEGITAQASESEGIEFFDSPHEDARPLKFEQPEEVGIHYLGTLSHPGDSHSFNETKEVLALPITAPWGSSVKAIRLAFSLKPKFVIPIHDWHWSEEARKQSYNRYEKILAQENITMFKPETGQTIDINL